MAKKKQPDFQPVKLKPGRHINKAANQMETRFKSKKIVVPNTKAKSKNQSTNTILDCIKIVKENAHLATRRKALVDLNGLISKDPESLKPSLSDVVEHILRLILDMESSLRTAALEVIVTVLSNTTDLQLQTFSPLFIKIISCCMKHSNFKIKDHSLNLLTAVLKLHPSLICHSMEILTHLLQMLIGGPRTRNSTHSKSKNVMLYSEEIYSPDYRIHILEHIHFFLKEMLNKKSAKQNGSHDEQEVYWDSKSPLYLQIYSEGGLKPFDIEKYYCNSSEENSEDSEHFLMFLENIVKTLPSVFVEEILVDKNCDDNTYDFKTICNINVIFQIYCSVSELLQHKHATDLDGYIFKFLKEHVYDKGIFPFSQKGAIFGRDEKAIVCVQLNLCVIRLLCIYLSNSLNEKSFLDSVYDYMEFVYKLSPELKYKCLPMIVEILGTFFTSKGTTENSKFLSKSLTQLCSLLKLYDRDEKTKDILLSLFTRISLDPTYSCIAKTECMKNWFMWLLSKPFEMARNGNVNREILKLVKKIASRSFPWFQRCLEKIDFEQLLRLLKCDDEAICDAAIFIICNIEIINSDMLTCISMFISSDDDIPARLVIRLIRLLTYRFFNKPEHGKKIPEDSIYSGKGLIAFVRFLLNVALDSFSLTNLRFTSLDANEYAESLKIFVNVTDFNVIPSLHWKQHSEIFEVCHKFLKWLPQNVVSAVFEAMFKEIMGTMTLLPMHCTIALFKLFTEKRRKELKKKYRAEIAELCFASLLTVSLLTSKSLDEDWNNYNVVELTKSMQVNSQLALGVVHRMQYLGKNGYNSLAAYHMLRVCKYFIDKQHLDADNFQEVIGYLDLLREKCSDRNLGQQPLYITLFNHMTYYM